MHSHGRYLFAIYFNYSALLVTIPALSLQNIIDACLVTCVSQALGIAFIFMEIRVVKQRCQSFLSVINADATIVEVQYRSALTHYDWRIERG